VNECTTPFLDFYIKNRISPVSQDLSDLNAHFLRRAALYRHLGLPPRLIAGKTVLEFGPGGGHNALYTRSLEPARYVLVDANPTGLENLRRLLIGGEDSATRLEVVEGLIQDFDTPERFDLVLAEGVIPWQRDPEAMLRHVAGFAAPGGLVIITCIDAVSSLSENLRRLMAAMLTGPGDSLQARTAALLPVFGPHLDTLSGMTRPHADWIMDQILQPFVGRLMSISQAIAALDGEFDVYSASPRFLTDWTWYKEVPVRPESDNALATRLFEENLHNFIDYARSFPSREGNSGIAALCERIFGLIVKYEQTRAAAVLDVLGSCLEELTGEVGRFSPETAGALHDFTQGFAAARATGSFGPMPAFVPFFGRGQQYLSFVRKTRSTGGRR
jgi:SAM-dependent methyltransferase